MPPPVSRKVTFQPPIVGDGIHTSAGLSGEYKTQVGLIVDDTGRVTSVVPIEGKEPFLSETMRYARGWRFTKGFPAPASSPVLLSVTYHWDTKHSVIIDIKP